MSNPGLSPNVQAALQRRGAGGPEAMGQLNQVSPQAPMVNPVPQMSTPSDANKSSAPQASPPQKWEPQNQQDFIISALAEQLKNSQKLELEKTKIPQPSMGALPVAQVQPPMGGGNPYGGGSGSNLRPNMFSSPSDSKIGYFDMSSPAMPNTSKQSGYPF